MLAYPNVRASVFSLVALTASGCQLYFTPSGGSNDAADRDASRDAPKPSANVIFLTTATYDGNLSGRAGADEKCRAAAGAAGLTGTFIAVIGADGEAIDPSATSRLRNAQGWILPSGKPVMNDAADLLSGNQWYPIIEDQRGNDLSASSEYWSGTNSMGDPGNQCQQWTSSSGTGNGEYGKGSEATGLGQLTGECNQSKHLLCAATDLNAPLPAPTRGNQKFVFVSKNLFGSTVNGRDAADAICAAEATSATLPGTYVAVLGAQGTAAITRFNSLAQYQRTDGLPLGFLSAPASFINRAADRSIVNRDTWAEPLAASPQVNCNDWTDNNVATSGGTGSSESAGAAAFDNYLKPCNQAFPVFCAQL